MHNFWLSSLSSGKGGVEKAICVAISPLRQVFLGCAWLPLFTEFAYCYLELHCDVAMTFGMFFCMLLLASCKFRLNFGFPKSRENETMSICVLLHGLVASFDEARTFF